MIKVFMIRVFVEIDTDDPKEKVDSLSDYDLEEIAAKRLAATINKKKNWGVVHENGCGPITVIKIEG